MRHTTGILIAIIAILLALLVHETQRRHAAEAALDRIIAVRPRTGARPAAAAHGENDLTSRLHSLIEENRQLRAELSHQPPPGADENAAKIAALKDILMRLPEQSIPEIALATEADWYGAVDGPLETFSDYRAALAKLRDAAEKRFAARARPALFGFLAAHGDAFPTDVSELAAYFTVPVNNAILSRYEVVPASQVGNVRVGGEWALTQKSLIDSKYDQRVVIGPQGYGLFGGSK